MLQYTAARQIMQRDLIILTPNLDCEGEPRPYRPFSIPQNKNGAHRRESPAQNALLVVALLVSF
jgi:hypothetical protein